MTDILILGSLEHIDLLASHSTVGGMSNDYKAAKEAFVSGMTGSSIMHVNLVSLVALVRQSAQRASKSYLTFYSVVLGITLLSPMHTPSNKPTYKLRSFMDPPCTPPSFVDDALR